MFKNMFNLVNLFTVPVVKVFIDPKLYNKSHIIDTVEQNYNQSNYRNNWDKKSKLHHYYEDWDNGLFKQIDFSSLIPVYSDIFTNFVNNIPSIETLEFKFEIANVTVYKNKGDYMDVHHHMIETTTFACVHYINVGKNSGPLRFLNPASVSKFLSKPILDLRDKKLDLQDTFNSFACEYYDINMGEDEMIIFPSFLLHGVKQEKSDKKLRIAIATNLSLF